MNEAMQELLERLGSGLDRETTSHRRNRRLRPTCSVQRVTSDAIYAGAFRIDDDPGSPFDPGDDERSHDDVAKLDNHNHANNDRGPGERSVDCRARVAADG